MLPTGFTEVLRVCEITEQSAHSSATETKAGCQKSIIPQMQGVVTICARLADSPGVIPGCGRQALPPGPDLLTNALVCLHQQRGRDV